MKRRDFVGLTSAGMVLTLAGFPVFAQQDQSGLVGTPKQRQEYTLNLLRKLCTEIGPRPSGSKSFAKGAKIIKQEMKRSLPYVGYDTYDFEKWELIRDPEFLIGGQRIEAVPAYGEEGTSIVGMKGFIQKSNSGFIIVDELSGKPAASITISPYGKAITHYQGRTSGNTIPSFSIGKQDKPLLESAVKNRTQAWVKFPTRFIPGAKGCNIVGKLPGKRKDEILFLAHADTVYNSPGANDNTASVILMMMLAHSAATSNYNHTLTFVATDNEEFGYFGANHYAEKCIADDTMQNIRFVINLDSLTYGNNLWISSKQEQIKDILKKIHKDLNIDSAPIFDSSDGFVMDSEPFRPSGAQALHANSRGYDEKTLPVYHRPDDTADTVPLDSVENSFLVFDEFLRRIDKI
ncbi:M28 family metallopeptidase [Daejeonella sp.]|uniref:M28 family metallopeptidase n=1 Tax=Daejeonella sp. TaxID=2805397 RepID=UPI0030C3BCA7